MKRRRLVAVPYSWTVTRRIGWICIGEEICLSGARHKVFRLFFFFFQAEDGIRDLTVTGVQTCALPISTAGYAGYKQRLDVSRDRLLSSGSFWIPWAGLVASMATAACHNRSASAAA